MEKTVNLNSGDYCTVNMDDDENFIVLNGVIIHPLTIQNLSLIQHGFCFFNEMADKKALFDNDGLENFKKIFCDLYSWIVKSNLMTCSDSYRLPEKSDTILEYIQEQESIIRDLSVPGWFKSNGKHYNIIDKLIKDKFNGEK